jgi:hypothetical protein
MKNQDREIEEKLRELDIVTNASRIRRPLRRGMKILIGVAVLAVIASVVIAAVLVAHTFPGFTPTGPVSSACATLVAASFSTPSGWVQFGCPSAAPALVATAGSAQVTLTGFPAGYTALYIIQGGSPTTSCTTGPTFSLQISPGPTTVNFGTSPTPVGNFNYCASFTDVTPKASFTASWS